MKRVYQEEFDDLGNDLAGYWEDRINLGIKTHDGQKLLVQYILDTDSGLSENSRKILEEFIK